MLTLGPYIITDEDTVNIDDSTERTVLSITESSQSASMLAEATVHVSLKQIPTIK